MSLSNEQTDKILSLRRSQYSYDSIAILTGAQKSTIATICQRHGLIGRSNQHRNAHEIINMRRAGYTFREISEKYLLPLSSTKTICQSYEKRTGEKLHRRTEKQLDRFE